MGKPHQLVYTNTLLGDAGFLNSVQRGDTRAANGTAWVTHVSRVIVNVVLTSRPTPSHHFARRRMVDLISALEHVLREGSGQSWVQDNTLA